MSAIDPNKCLPPKLCVQSVDDILYRIGLSLYSIRDRPKRQLINHPLIVFIILFICLTERLITVSLSDEFVLVFKALGSAGYFIGIRQHFDTFFFLMTLLVLSSKTIHYYNYRNGIKPTFLRVFQMMSGLVPPKSLGLTDEREIIKLLKITRRLYSSIKFQNDYMRLHFSLFLG